MKLKARQIWTLAVIAGALVLVVVISLIAAGVLVLPGTPAPSPVTVTEVTVNVLQGKNASGDPWFGPSPFNYTGVANGYPYHVSPGASFTIAVSLNNVDRSNHTIYSIIAAPPFTLIGCHPNPDPTPVIVPALSDDVFFQLSFTAPNSAGASLGLNVTFNALTLTASSPC